MIRIFSTVAAAIFASAIAAEEITLKSEIEGRSLHGGGVDMAVYYLDRQDHFEVVATYISPAYGPARIRMGLVDGDSTTFGLPGLSGRTYTFARIGDEVHVSTEAVPQRVARND